MEVVGNRKLRKCYSILISVYEYQIESIYNPVIHEKCNKYAHQVWGTLSSVLEVREQNCSLHSLLPQ